MIASYRHTQRATWTMLGLAAAMLLALVVGAGTSPPAAVAMIAILLISLALFTTLTVEVDASTVEVAFGFRVIRRRIDRAQIRAVQVVRNRWYYGWGIRLTPHGWLWCVWGLDAVELELADGKRFRIGTDEPEALASALQA